MLSTQKPNFKTGRGVLPLPAALIRNNILLRQSATTQSQSPLHPAPSPDVLLCQHQAIETVLSRYRLEPQQTNSASQNTSDLMLHLPTLNSDESDGIHRGDESSSLRDNGSDTARSQSVRRKATPRKTLVALKPIRSSRSRQDSRNSNSQGNDVFSLPEIVDSTTNPHTTRQLRQYLQPPVPTTHNGNGNRQRASRERTSSGRSQQQHRVSSKSPAACSDRDSGEESDDESTTPQRYSGQIRVHPPGTDGRGVDDEHKNSFASASLGSLREFLRTPSRSHSVTQIDDDDSDLCSDAEDFDSPVALLKIYLHSADKLPRNDDDEKTACDWTEYRPYFKFSVHNRDEELDPPVERAIFSKPFPISTTCPNWGGISLGVLDVFDKEREILRVEAFNGDQLLAASDLKLRYLEYGSEEHDAIKLFNELDLDGEVASVTATVILQEVDIDLLSEQGSETSTAAKTKTKAAISNKMQGLNREKKQRGGVFAWLSARLACLGSHHSS